MNLASLNFAPAANSGAVMTVLHPIDRIPLETDGGDPVTITLLGRDSDAFIKAETAARQRAMDSLSKGSKVSVTDADRRGCESLARLVTGWQGIPEGWIDGTDSNDPADFSVENAMKLFLNPGVRWIRDQADAFVADRGNFLKASQTS